ncbi:hypothetical protein GGR57DRAFT_488039 [Xylariaceae sp. FL1272]|nr:hypothetical protein GGR57DRAFT_488039 [Xylariaceae sp. FL1272]
MRFFHLLSTFGAIMAGTHAAPDPLDPFGWHCQNASMYGTSSWLQTFCLPGDQNFHTVFNHLNLNHCLVNIYGELKAQPEGNFANSCKNIEVEGTILTADCSTTAITAKSSKIDLNDVIKVEGTDSGAVLKCFDAIACNSKLTGPGGDCNGNPGPL